MKIEDMTIDELIAEYNRHGPVESLEHWSEDRYELVEMVRIATKQSGSDGVVAGVTYSIPNTSRRSD